MDRAVRSNLLEPLTALVGREAALDGLEVAFGREGRRWVTLRGSPGVGKTALAIDFAASQPLATHPGGVWMCDLSRAKDRRGVCTAIARVLEIAASPRGLRRALEGRGATLLVLDAADAVGAHVADLLEGWLPAAPSLRVLIISHARTGGAGETTVELDALDEDAGVSLLRARAREARGRELPAGAATDAALLAIVQALGGNPLAIELAAAQLVALSPAQLAGPRRLDAVLDALLAATRAAHPAPASRKVLAAGRAMDRTWRRLGPGARRALEICALFAAEAPGAAVEVLLGGPAGARALALAELADRSLVVVRPHEAGVTFQVPALVRRHAVIALERRADAEAIRARWAVTVLELAEAAATDLEAPGRVAILVAHRADLETLAERALEQGDPGRCARALDLLATLARLQGAASPRTWDLLVACLAHEGDLEPGIALRLLHARARLAHTSGRPRKALADFAGAWDRASRSASADRARIASDWAGLLRHLGRRDEARALYEEALAIDLARGDAAGRGRTVAAIASMLHEEGDTARARARYEEAAGLLARGLAAPLALATTRQNLGLVHQEQGDLDGAERIFRAALGEHRRLGHRRFEAIGELDLASLEVERARPTLALQGLHRAAAIARASGLRRELGLAEALVGVCLVMRDPGDASEADAALDRAQRELSAVEESALLDALELHRGHLDLARARRARAAGARSELTEASAALAARLARGAAAAREAAAGDELRFALRILLAERARWEERARGAMVAHDGSFFVVTKGSRLRRVDLDRRAILRTLLAALIAQHLRAPEEAMSPVHLARSAWPEGGASHARRNRLHVAIATLRRLGLEGHLVRSEGGYRLERVHVRDP